MKKKTLIICEGFKLFVVGTTAAELTDGMSRITQGAVIGRFFCTYPARNFDIRNWLGYWIKQGTCYSSSNCIICLNNHCFICIKPS